MYAVAYCFSLIPFYLLGSFPTGFLVARAKGISISEQGSGNVGATNVARVVGKKAGLITLLGDVIKGALAVLIAALVAPSPQFISAAGVAAVAGHCFSLPPYLKGGKGVATALGVFLVLSPLATLGGIVFFGAALQISRIVSLSSVIAATVVPIFAMLLNVENHSALALACASLIVIFRHRTNLARLIEGKEQQFSFKK